MVEETEANGGGWGKESQQSVLEPFFFLCRGQHPICTPLNAPLCSTHAKEKSPTHRQAQSVAEHKQKTYTWRHKHPLNSTWCCVAHKHQHFIHSGEGATGKYWSSWLKKEIAAWPLKQRSQASQHFKYSADPYLSRSVGGPRGPFFPPLKCLSLMLYLQSWAAHE